MNDKFVVVLRLRFEIRGEMIEHYEAKSGRSLDTLPFYVAFNYFKTACILQGVYARFARGVRSTQGFDLDGLCDRVDSSGRSAQIVLETL